MPIDTNYRLDSPHDVCLNKDHTGPYIFRDHTTFTEHVDCNAVLLYGEGEYVVFSRDQRSVHGRFGRQLGNCRSHRFDGPA